MPAVRTRNAAINVIFSLTITIISAGCLTVRMDNEFTETVESYSDDGALQSVSQTRWTQNARGGPFTDVERLKQDTLYSYEGSDGSAYEIGQGSGAEGVSGEGQRNALIAALQALSAALSAVLPPE